MQPGQDPTRRIPDPTRRWEDPTRRITPPEDATRRMTPPPEGGGPLLGGRYRLEGLLGSGGMADVHRAEDLRLHRPVAVKVFRPGTDPDGERRFADEARTLARLRHPGLVAVHDYAVERGRAFLVMELVEGPTLAEELQRERYDAAGATQLGLELARVLAHVHDEGVVHRDVKPSNILIDRDGRVRLADFGIAQLAGTSGLTSVGSTVGTASYLAPEQVQGRPAGPPADVYALGLVLLEAMSGHREYDGDGWAAADERLRRPPHVPRELPEPLRRTLREMTALEPERRPDAHEVARRLGTAAPEPEPPPVAPEPVRRGSGLAVAGAVAVLAIVALLAVVLLNGGDEQPPPVATEPDPTVVAPEPAPEPAPGDGFTLPSLPTALPELPDLPDLPAIPTSLPELPDASDLPQLPDVPELPDVQVPEEARSAWEQFTDWFTGLF